MVTLLRFEDLGITFIVMIVITIGWCCILLLSSSTIVISAAPCSSSSSTSLVSAHAVSFGYFCMPAYTEGTTNICQTKADAEESADSYDGRHSQHYDHGVAVLHCRCPSVLFMLQRCSIATVVSAEC